MALLIRCACCHRQTRIDVEAFEQTNFFVYGLCEKCKERAEETTEEEFVEGGSCESGG